MAVNLEKKIANKLNSVNVPEMFYQTFLEDIPAGTCSIVDRLRTITPTARGRGFSRVVKNLTQDEWDDLYAHAARARQAIIGADRETNLKPAICGKSLALRMEELGVSNPVAWAPSKVYKPRKAVTEEAFEDVQDVAKETTEDVVAAVATPITIPTADDVDEVTGEELEMLNQEVNQQKA